MSKFKTNDRIAVKLGKNQWKLAEVTTSRNGLVYFVFDDKTKGSENPKNIKLANVKKKIKKVLTTKELEDILKPVPSSIKEDIKSFDSPLGIKVPTTKSVKVTENGFDILSEKFKEVKHIKDDDISKEQYKNSDLLGFDRYLNTKDGKFKIIILGIRLDLKFKYSCLYYYDKENKSFGKVKLTKSNESDLMEMFGRKLPKRASYNEFLKLRKELKDWATDKEKVIKNFRIRATKNVIGKQVKFKVKSDVTSLGEISRIDKENERIGIITKNKFRWVDLHKVVEIYETSKSSDRLLDYLDNDDKEAEARESEDKKAVDIAILSDNDYMKAAAASNKNITLNQFAKLLKTNPSGFVLKAAINNEKISYYATKFAAKSVFEEARAAAMISKFANKKMLINGMKDKSSIVRFAALCNANADKSIIVLGLNDSNATVRNKAKELI